MRILVGVAMLASLALVGQPAQANHGGLVPTVDKNHIVDNHESKPAAPAVHDPNAECAVTGTVTVPEFASPAPVDHDPSIAQVNEEPSHSHYTFEGVVISCVGPDIDAVLLSVNATGGNDGHCLDIWPGTDGSPGTGADECILETGIHPHNDHHGSINESAWSNGSMFDWNWPKPEWCGPTVPTPPSLNKGVISAEAVLGVPVDAGGWVKYIRLGPNVLAWGEFPCRVNFAALGIPDHDAFTSELVFLPAPPCDDREKKLKGGGTSAPQPQSCFILNGTATLHASHLKSGKP